MLVLLAAVAVLGFEGYAATMQGAAITAAADQISDTLNEARAAAMAQNTPVEVRLYDHILQPGAAPVYNAIQLRWVKPDQSTPPVSPLVTLSPWVALDATAAHSPLIADTPAVASDASDPNLNADTRAFRYDADGSTDLTSGKSWFLTVRAVTQSDPARFPADWACVAVDPATGRAQIYRP